MSTAAPPAGADAADITSFIALVDKEIGVQLHGKEYLIESRLQPVAVAVGSTDVGDLLRTIRRGDRVARSKAIEAMTTNETSFFRDQHPFEMLVQHVLPDAAKNGRLTVWNGATSSGQESYTLAMSIIDNFPTLAMPGKSKILSTDVSPEMVARTKDGVYSRFEVNRGLPTNLAVKHFDQTGRSWTAKPALRAMIEAREVNLLQRWSGIPKCDIVLLRNVLIYFTLPVRKDILRRVRTEVLKPGGCLVLGASESTTGIDDGYESRRVGSSTFFYPRGVS